jgi:UDP-N-acetylglucosamine 4,6-dehydratase
MSEPRRVTILGGTGSLGRSLVQHIGNNWNGCEITVVSRDEHKHAAMKRSFPKVRFAIGDIRDLTSIHPHISGRDTVFHVAALKHVDLMEDAPIECIKTNVWGTENVAQAAIAAGVKHVVFSSTDKAVDPINTYGYCKALSEKILFQHNRTQSQTKFSVYRWGNVLGSNGSAIPVFAETLKNQSRAFLTHNDMSRFWLPIEWAVLYMLRTYPDAYPDRAMIPPNMKAAYVKDVIEVVAELLGVSVYTVTETAIRPGEKLHEVMTSIHSSIQMSSEHAEKYSRAELRQLLTPIVLKAMERAA